MKEQIQTSAKRASMIVAAVYDRRKRGEIAIGDGHRPPLQA
jgi:hypothetical protein